MSIVASYCVSHAPGMVAWPDRPDPEQSGRLLAAFTAVGDRLAAARADAVILVTPEHFANFFSIRPAIYINVGEESEGPAEKWLGVARRTVPGHQELATAILEHAYRQGFDLAYGHDLLLDHGAIVPLELMHVASDTPVIPVIVNGLVDPMPTFERCAEWGASLGDFLAGRSERIALVGAGGLSHWPGMAEQGKLSPAWDRAVLNGLGAGNREVLREPPQQGRADAGPGANELRSWTVVGFATPDGEAEVLSYEEVPQWAGGLAVVDLMPKMGSPAESSVGRVGSNV